MDLPHDRRFRPRVLGGLAAGLWSAPECGLVHRDVKPANTMLCRHGRAVDHVKVLDFGSVAVDPAALDASRQLTHTGTLFGTPSYLAPEILSGKGSGDARSDLYGVGCVAYWLLAGRIPAGPRRSARRPSDRRMGRHQGIVVRR